VAPKPVKKDSANVLIPSPGKIGSATFTLTVRMRDVRHVWEFLVLI
jgi:hypothetical protein